MGETFAAWEAAKGICPAKAGRRPHGRASGRERVSAGVRENHSTKNPLPFNEENQQRTNSTLSTQNSKLGFMVAVREDLCASVVKFAKNKGNHTEIVPPRAENFLCASLALHALAGI
jgi:hypothetical protein